MRIIVASKNPVKIDATRRGFERAFPNQSIEALGVAVDSGVDAQPMSDEETLRGARQRVDAAAAAHAEVGCWAGLEGGIEDDGCHMNAFAWVVVRQGNDYGRSRTACFELPPQIADLVRGGMELGDADDRVFGEVGSKHKQGAVGLLTDGLLDRAGLYEPAVVLALIPMLNSHLFPSANG